MLYQQPGLSGRDRWPIHVVRDGMACWTRASMQSFPVVFRYPQFGAEVQSWCSRLPGWEVAVAFVDCLSCAVEFPKVGACVRQKRRRQGEQRLASREFRLSLV